MTNGAGLVRYTVSELETLVEANEQETKMTPTELSTTLQQLFGDEEGWQTTAAHRLGISTTALGEYLAGHSVVGRMLQRRINLLHIAKHVQRTNGIIWTILPHDDEHDLVLADGYQVAVMRQDDATMVELLLPDAGV